jgi:predicted transcriptional regulator
MKTKDLKHVGVKMPAGLSRKIEAIAAAENNSVSAVVRRILTAGIEREAAQKAAGTGANQ